MWRVGDPPGGTGMGDAATGGGQGSGGTSQGWRREDVVGGWTKGRMDGRDTGNRKNKNGERGKIMIRKITTEL